MMEELNRSGVGDIQVCMRVLMFVRDQYIRELVVMMELVSPMAWVAYLGATVVRQVLIEAVCLPYWEARRVSTTVRGCLGRGLGLGDVQAWMSILMVSRNRYFWDLLPSLLLMTGRPVAWLEFSFRSLSQPLRALRSVVESFRLVGEQQTSQPPEEDKRGQQKHQDIPNF